MARVEGKELKKGMMDALFDAITPKPKEKTVQEKKDMLGSGGARQTANLLTNKDKQIKDIFGE